MCHRWPRPQGRHPDARRWAWPAERVRAGVCQVSGHALAHRGQGGVDTSTPVTGLILKTSPRLAPPAAGEIIMRSTTDHVHEGRDQTAHPPTDERVPDGPMDAPRETEASFEEIER
jgi:hypothetical protein